ncbi:MAG: choice-of-anchor Q domain-containing protein, partial [Aureispira sp.]
MNRMKIGPSIKLFITICLLLSSISSFAKTIYVDLNATGANNGTSWTNAYTNIEWAFAFAVSGDDIWLAKGTYYTSTMNDPNNTFALVNGVNLYGNFVGTETNINQRVGLIPDSTGIDRINETILSGDIGVLGDRSDNAYRIMYLVGNTLPFVIDGIKVVGANSRAGVLQGNGAGIFIQNGTDVTLNNVVIADNLCQVQNIGGGAGIYLDNCTSLTLNSSVIRDNAIIDDPTHNSTVNNRSTGAGIFSNSASIYINNSTISNNNIKETDVIRGGGIYLYSFVHAEILINNSFIGNSVLSASDELEGGGVYFYSSANAEMLVNNSFIGNNNSITTSYNSELAGGGIYFNCYQYNSPTIGNLTILNSQINNSTSETVEGQGGGVYFIGDSLDITDSEMNYNGVLGSDVVYGGALSVDNVSYIRLNNSDFNYNSLDGEDIQGIGVFLDSGTDTVQIDSCSFSHNMVQSSTQNRCVVKGGGLYTNMPTIITNSTLDSNSIDISVNRNTSVASTSVFGQGGGLCNYGSIDIDNCTFHDNNITTYLRYGFENYFTFRSQISNSEGGGLYSSGWTNLKNSTIRNNILSSETIAVYAGYACRAYSHGGGIYLSAPSSINDTSRISNCEIIGNETNAIASSDINTARTSAGGMYVGAGHEVHIEDCIVNANKTYMENPYNSSTEGGGIYFTGLGHIYRTEIGYNQASALDGDVSGGGIYFGGGNTGSPNIASCLIHNNSVTSEEKAYGGGIYNIRRGTMSNLTVVKNKTNSTINDNDGAGVYNNASTSLYNSIVYYNQTTNNYFGSSSALPLHCVIQYFSNGATNFNIPPFFIDTTTNNFHVAANSIAINRGNNTYIPTGLNLDLEGNPRILNTTVDIGAYERNPCVDQTLLTETICQGSSYLFNGQNLTVTGVHKDTLQNVSNCDSIITLNLTVINTILSTDVQTACNSY